MRRRLPRWGPLSELGPQGQGPAIDEVILEVMEKVVNLVVDRGAALNVVMFDWGLGRGVTRVVEGAGALKVVLFDCGLGAGAYPVWLGRTAASEPACFVADL